MKKWIKIEIKKNELKNIIWCGRTPAMLDYWSSIVPKVLYSLYQEVVINETLVHSIVVLYFNFKIAHASSCLFTMTMSNYKH